MKQSILSVVFSIPLALTGCNGEIPSAPPGSTESTTEESDPDACVGESAGIANWHIMQHILEALSALGTDTEFHSYPGLRHGFGIGTGTVAEGWLNQAVSFWKRQNTTN